MKLRDWLSQQDISEARFADDLGTSQGTVNRYVRGERIPRPAIMAKISAATKGAVTAMDFYAEHAAPAAAAPVAQAVS